MLEQMFRKGDYEYTDRNSISSFVILTIQAPVQPPCRFLDDLFSDLDYGARDDDQCTLSSLKAHHSIKPSPNHIPKTSSYKSLQESRKPLSGTCFPSS